VLTEINLLVREFLIENAPASHVGGADRTSGILLEIFTGARRKAAHDATDRRVAGKIAGRVRDLVDPMGDHICDRPLTGPMMEEGVRN
jgi:hypothetical protein